MKQKKFYRTLFYICILLACNAKLFAQTDERPRLISLEKRRFELMIHHDTTQLSSLLADSLIYIHSSGVIDNKASFMKDIGSEHITYLFILPEKVVASVDGN